MTRPTGTVTFLFTDVEGSTQLWERHPEAMQTAMACHDALLRRAVEDHGGVVIKTTGDGLHAAFDSAAGAAEAALAGQRALAAEAWGDAGPLRARMAIHCGEAQYRDGDYYGPALNRTARLMAAGHGGQVLLSAAAAALLRETLAGRAEVLLVDLGEHRLRDLAVAEHMYQLNSPGLPAQFPPLRSLESFRHNLPAQLTSFVGREREMAEVKRLLGHARLLTLTGPGGTGKTRLALQVAAELLPEGRYPDGAWLVELAPISDGGLVPQAIAAALGVREQPGRSLDEALLDYVRYKRLLLLLDNCEHLVEGCARTAEWLLRAAPGLTILASGREALAIAGEVTFQVPSLRLPAVPAGADMPLAEGLDSEAVCLFVERAQAVRPDFNLTGANAPAVVEICRRLDGIPLAIELAAARVRLLPAEQIAARLGDRFRLLTGGSRTALPRQQTLQALIDWSWELLPEPERRLLRRLAVFAGGWTIDAAEAVASALPPVAAEPIDVLEGLGQLVNKSLVIADVDANADGQGRYRLLETIRQYARDRLLEAGETAALRDRHADFYLQLVLEAEPHLIGREMIPWLYRLDTDYDNVRAAIEWLLESRPDQALRLAAALNPYWLRRLLPTESRRWLEQAIERARELPATSAHQTALARAVTGLAGALMGQGEYLAALDAGAEGVTLARQSGSPQALASALGLVGLINQFLVRREAAAAAAEEAIAVGRRYGLDWETLMAYSGLFRLAVFDGNDLSRAHAYLDELDHLNGRINNHWANAMTAMDHAWLAAREGDLAKARDGFGQAAARFDEMGDQRFGIIARSELAHVLRRQGEAEQALVLYRQMLRHWQPSGHRAAIAHQLECLAFIAAAQDRPGAQLKAARLLAAAVALREAADSTRMPDEQAEYDQAVAAVGAKLGASAWAKAWEEGKGMSIDQAVEYGLD